MAEQFKVVVTERVRGFDHDGEFVSVDNVLGHEYVMFDEVTAEEVGHYVIPNLYAFSGFGSATFGGTEKGYGGPRNIEYIGDGTFTHTVPNYDFMDGREFESEFRMEIVGLGDLDFSEFIDFKVAK